jgi:hypothetical protein
VYGGRKGLARRDKPAVLRRLQEDGFWLIDAVEYPVNKLDRRERIRALKASVPRLVERCHQLAPERGAVVCRGKVFAAAAPALRELGSIFFTTNPFLSRSGTGVRAL